MQHSITMSGSMINPTSKGSAEYLSKAATLLTSTSPALARFFMDQVLEQRYDPNSSTSQQTCQFCGSILHPDNHILRFKPRVKLNKKLQHLLATSKRAGSAHRLGRYQKRLLDMCKNTATQQLITCSICSKTSKVACCKLPIKTTSRRLDNTSGKGIPCGTSQSLTKSQKKKLKKKKQAKRTEAEILSHPASNEFLSTPVTNMPNLGHHPKSSLRNALDASLTSSTVSNSSFTSPATPHNRSHGSFIGTPSPNTAAAAAAVASSKSSKKKRSKDKMMCLQKILSQQNQKSSPNTLQSFLSSL